MSDRPAHPAGPAGPVTSRRSGGASSWPPGGGRGRTTPPEPRGREHSYGSAGVWYPLSLRRTRGDRRGEDLTQAVFASCGEESHWAPPPRSAAFPVVLRRHSALHANEATMPSPSAAAASGAVDRDRVKTPEPLRPRARRRPHARAEFERGWATRCSKRCWRNFSAGRARDASPIVRRLKGTSRRRRPRAVRQIAAGRE